MRTVVITGANSGIGLGLKNLYTKNGDRVITLDKSVEQNTDTEFFCDVSVESEVLEVFDIIGEKYGHIDVLINCAGYAVYGATELIDTNKAKAMFDVNYFGMLSCIKGALKYMQKGSRIVNISSACAFFAVPFRTHYSASKSAVSMLSYGLWMELKDSGIDVICICPGDVRTNFSKNRVKTFDTNERYGNKIEESAKQIDEREPKRMTIEFATKKMFKICNKKRPKQMYIVGSSMKWAYIFGKIFPLSLILKFTKKYF